MTSITEIVSWAASLGTPGAWTKLGVACLPPDRQERAAQEVRGPDMALAGKLPDCKEAVIVVRYQELRLDIRQRDEPDLREWIVLIEAGRTLDGNHHFVF